MKYFVDPIVKFIVFCSVFFSVAIPIYSHLTVVKVDGTLLAMSVILIIIVPFVIFVVRIVVGPPFTEQILNKIFNSCKKDYKDNSHADDVITRIKAEFGVKITSKDESILWEIYLGKKSSRQISQAIKLSHYYVTYRLSVLEDWGILKNDVFVELNPSIKTIFENIQQ